MWTNIQQRGIGLCSTSQIRSHKCLSLLSDYLLFAVLIFGTDAECCRHCCCIFNGKVMSK